MASVYKAVVFCVLAAVLFSSNCVLAAEPQPAPDSPLLTPQEFCKAFVNNPSIVRFSTASDIANNNEMGLSTIFIFYDIFVRNDLVRQWVENKKGLVNNQGLNEFKRNVMTTCGDELAHLDALIELAGDKNTYFRNVEALEACKTTKTKKMNDDGSISMVSQNCDVFEKEDLKFRRAHLLLPEVFMFKNGENVVRTAIEEPLKKFETQVSELLNEKKTTLASMNASKNEAETRQKETATRIAQMRQSGAYSIAANCAEVAQAISAQNVYGFLPSALLKPDSKPYYTYVKLYEFDGTNGHIRDETQGRYSEVVSSKNTLWLHKEQISIGGMVEIVGRYTENGSVTLVTGAGQTVRKYELICIEPAGPDTVAHFMKH